MFDAIASLLTVLNTLSPLAVIGLLATIIFLQVRNPVNLSKQIDTIGNNHLHEMPEMADSLRRIETTLTALDAFLRAKL